MDAPGFGLNLLDVLLLVLLAYSVTRGFRQGALAQVAAFGGAAVGLLVGAAFAPEVAGLFVSGPGANLALLTLLLLVAGIFMGQAAGVAVGFRLAHAADRAGVGGLDRGAGMAVGAAGLALVVWLFGTVLAQGPVPAVAQQVRSSVLVGALDRSLPPPPDVFGRVATYLDQQGFPQVVTGLGGGISTEPVPPTSNVAVQSAAAAAQASTVQIRSIGCGGISSGSGFAVQPGFIVTNAHVVAGGEVLAVRDVSGEHDAVAVHVDPQLDLAVLSAPASTATPVDWATAAAERGVEGATLGFPGGQRELAVKPATVRGRFEAVGRDIYGNELVRRDILALSAQIQQGDSGGPFVSSDGLVGGVVFAGSPDEASTGYALTAAVVRADVDAAIAANTAVPTGECRF